MHAVLEWDSGVFSKINDVNLVTRALGAGAYAILSPLPLIAITLLTAFELLVAFLQAYVFAILTCVYLNDAIHPGH